MDKENAATNVRRRSGSSASGRAKSTAARRKPQTRRKTSGTRRKSSRGSDIAAVIARLPKPVLAGAVALIVLIIIIVFAAKGCGVSHKTPERVVRTLIESYTGGNESKVKKCYGVSKADDALQQEMDATVKYFSAFEAEKTEITQCDKIYQNGNYTYIDVYKRQAPCHLQDTILIPSRMQVNGIQQPKSLPRLQLLLQ